MACGVPQKCSGRYTHLIRAYIISVCTVLISAAFLVAVSIGTAVYILPAALTAGSLLAAITLPDLYVSGLTYTRHRNWLMIERGLIFRQTLLIPRRQIQYIRLCRGPAERIFGLATLVFMTSAGKVSMHGLDPVEAERLRRLLERTE